MRRTAIPAGAGRQRAQQIDLREELDEIAGPHRARFHEILVRIVGEAGAHEHVEHVMHQQLRLAHVHPAHGGKRARQVGVAAMMVIVA